MNARIVKCEPAPLPEGVYAGIMGGYVIRIDYNGTQYSVEVDVGVKCLNCKVTMKVMANNRVKLTF